MPLLPDHLRCQIRIRPTKRLRQIPSLEPILRQPKIRDLCMPLIIQHHILRLQIPKDHPSGVQMVDGKDDFRDVELGFLLREDLLAFEVG